jgi:riboflavin synthase
MFSGIVSAIGEVIDVETAGELRLEIASDYAARSLVKGASISCSGICLTVIEAAGRGARGSSFSVQASAETRERTTLGHWARGTCINLERAMKLGDEIGGHIVSGHVDGICTIIEVSAEGESKRFRFRMPPKLAPFIAEKGSVCLDGTSLTVNAVEDQAFSVNIIPYTLKVTTWGKARPGDAVNIEIDMLARYVARLQEFQSR